MFSAPTLPTCPICFEAPLRRLPSRPCCRQTVCHSCLHRHARSVFEEGLTGGRTTLTCPLGCGADLADAEIRACIRRANWNFWRHVVGSWVLRLISFVGLFDAKDGSVPMMPYYSALVWLTQTPEERDELRRYEQWSLSVGLAASNHRPNASSTTEEDDLVLVRCPAPNCDYAWFASGPYRRTKLDNEHRRGGRARGGDGGGGFGSSIVRAASSYLFYRYRPPKPESGHCNWIDPDDASDPFHLRRRRPLRRRVRRADGRESGLGTDGRRTTCPRCNAIYCGLCRRPWTGLRASGEGGTIRHTGRSCANFGRRAVAVFGRRGGHNNLDADAFARAAHEAAGVRACPGCSMLTVRTWGCNHMTCPCGTQWCYVCERRWSGRHYSCNESSNGRGGGDGGHALGCIVS